MSNVLLKLKLIASKLKLILSKLRGYIPEPAPQGLTEFNNLITSIIATYAPPMDERSVRFTVAALLMRLNPTQSYITKVFFAKSLHRGAAAQVGAYVMEQIKNEQKAEFEASQKPAVASAPEAAVVESVQKQ